jgi:hypothetical protein
VPFKLMYSTCTMAQSTCQRGNAVKTNPIAAHDVCTLPRQPSEYQNLCLYHRSRPACPKALLISKGQSRWFPYMSKGTCCHYQQITFNLPTNPCKSMTLMQLNGGFLRLSHMIGKHSAYTNLGRMIAAEHSDRVAVCQPQNRKHARQMSNLGTNSKSLPRP